MQTSKVVALSYPIFGLIHTAIGIWLIPSSEETNFIRILLICMPIFIGLFGFVFTAIGCLQRRLCPARRAIAIAIARVRCPFGRSLQKRLQL